MTTEDILWNTYFEIETEEIFKTENTEMENELQALYEMTEAAACELYMVNNKAEAEILIKEYWN